MCDSPSHLRTSTKNKLLCHLQGRRACRLYANICPVQTDDLSWEERSRDKNFRKALLSAHASRMRGNPRFSLSLSRALAL
jgi:hypothetical protein